MCNYFCASLKVNCGLCKLQSIEQTCISCVTTPKLSPYGTTEWHNSTEYFLYHYNFSVKVRMNECVMMLMMCKINYTFSKKKSSCLLISALKFCILESRSKEKHQKHFKCDFLSFLTESAIYCREKKCVEKNSTEGKDYIKKANKVCRKEKKGQSSKRTK